MCVVKEPNYYRTVTWRNTHQSQLGVWTLEILHRIAWSPVKLGQDVVSSISLTNAVFWCCVIEGLLTHTFYLHLGGLKDVQIKMSQDLIRYSSIGQWSNVKQLCRYNVLQLIPKHTAVMCQFQSKGWTMGNSHVVCCSEGNRVTRSSCWRYCKLNIAPCLTSNDFDISYELFIEQTCIPPVHWNCLDYHCCWTAG